ncbi:MAG: UvrD-helicase domain-containing protein [Ruthenibacterium sp.]
MPEREWTPAQKNAIRDEGGTLLVSAAAGSGKTAVLVERAVRMLTDEAHPVAADRILMVTFTRAAAEELRARIAVRLSEEAALHPDSIHLRRQKLLLGRANICTIDAYCMQLLQRYFAELELPPDFGVADDAASFSLRQTALAAVLEDLYDDPDFCALASLYGRARSDASAAGAVLALYDFTRSLPRPHAVLEQLCAAYETGAPLTQTPWGRTLLSYALSAAENALKLTRAARGIVAEETALANYDAALCADESFFDALCGLVRQGRWDDAVCCTAEFTPPSLKAVRGYDGIAADAVKQLREGAKAAVKQLREQVFVCTEAQFLQDCACAAPMLRALARAALAFEERFYRAKLDEKLLEYSDFEHLALRLLCDENGQKTPLARIVAHGFDAVMVDEYQDTNALQAQLYRCLANDEEANLFFVGDAKQSVYRFRLASPEAFLEKRGSYAPYAQGGKHPATIILGHNFRSASSVIAQINDVFRCLMSGAVGDVDYTCDEELVPGAPDGYDGGPLELKLVDTGGAESEAGDAAVVADTIAQMLQSGFAVRDKTGGTRPCRCADFCILLRTRGKFTQYAAALTQRGISAYADTGESWLTSPEVSPLLSLLRVIDNPGQDVHLAAVLLSPLFGFTPDELAAVRAKTPHGRLFTALLQCKMPRAVQFCETLRILRTLAVTLPLDGLCAEIFVRTHYFAAVGAMENGAARRENLRSFTAFAAAATAGAASGLAGFLRRADSAIESGMGANGTAAVPQGNSVAIMTIHRSKGLEFPVCILADASHGFNLRDTSNAVLFHPVLGAGFKLRAENGGGLFATVPHAAVSFAQKRESVSEEMRILYVALTRARDKLIVTAPLKNPEKTLTNLAVGLVGTGGADAYVLLQQRSFAAWLCTVALLHPDCGALRKAAGGIVLPLLASGGHFHAEMLAAGAVSAAQEAPPFVRTAQPDAALTARLTSGFARAAARRAAKVRLPAKLSVSAISHADAQPVLARPAFLYKEGLTAAERGTAQHAFLQFADFDAAARDLQGELDRLVQKGYLAPELAEKLPRARIETFLQTPLAKRMQGAERLLREYDFITAVPAHFVTDDALGDAAYAPVLVQGIADAVCINGAQAEIVDYKTDRGKTPQQFVEVYAKQLLLYRRAMEKRLGVTVTACTIYAFENGLEIPVPLTAPTDL